MVGLAHARDRAGFALSSGMRAGLQLARALLQPPAGADPGRADGPVDPVAAYQFLELLQHVAIDQQVAALISSHRLEEIESLYDIVVLLDKGKLIYKGDLDALRRVWEQPRVEVHFHREDAAAGAASLLRDAGVRVVSVTPPSLTLASGMSVGRILHVLNGQLDDVSSVAESKMPLRELLAVILGAVPGERQQPPTQAVKVSS